MNEDPERITKCRSCGAPIILVQSVKGDGSPGKRVPLNADPINRGLVRFGPNGEKVRFAQIWESHNKTCPSSPKWKQKQ